MTVASDPTCKFIDLLRSYASNEGNLLTRGLEELVASGVPTCPTLVEPEANEAAEQAFRLLLVRNLDWEAVRNEAKRLLKERKDQEELRRVANKNTEILPIESLGSAPEANFARRWSAAWSSRNLEILLSFFRDDGEYRDLGFQANRASGKSALRQLFARIFHTSDLSLDVKGIGYSSDSKTLEWVRIGTRLEGVTLPRSYEFWGHSVIRFSSDRILSCEDQWAVLDGTMYVWMNRNGSKPEAARPDSDRIVVEPDWVIIDGIRVPRKGS